jgi:Protein of unknown function (DUF3276)
MENEKGNKNQDAIVYSGKVKAGKRRTYFMDVRQTKGNDYFLSITESTKRSHGEGYDRHKIFVYKEDFNRFVEELQLAVDHIKNTLMPDYDYDEYKRRNEEYEARAKEFLSESGEPKDQNVSKTTDADDEMSW